MLQQQRYQNIIELQHHNRTPFVRVCPPSLGDKSPPLIKYFTKLILYMSCLGTYLPECKEFPINCFITNISFHSIELYFNDTVDFQSNKLTV